MVIRLICMYLGIGIIYAITCFTAAYNSCMKERKQDLFIKIGPKKFLKHFCECAVTWLLDLSLCIFDTIKSIVKHYKES